MAASTDAGSFNPLWFLLVIPFVLIAAGIIALTWTFIARRRRARRRRSILRNVPSIQAEAESQLEKLERRASVRSKRSGHKSPNGGAGGAASPLGSLSRQERVSIERDLTRSVSTRSQREVYQRTLKARQQQLQHRDGGHQPHPTPFRLGVTQSDTGHGHATSPHRPRTPELEEGRAGFPSVQSDPGHTSTDTGPGPGSTSTRFGLGEESDIPSTRRFHHFRRQQDDKELSVIGETSESAALTPSASLPSSRMVLSPSGLIAAAAMDAQQAAQTKRSTGTEPALPAKAHSKMGSGSTTDASHSTLGSPRAATTDDSVTSPELATGPSESSGSVEGGADPASSSFGVKQSTNVGTAPTLGGGRLQAKEQDAQGTTSSHLKPTTAGDSADEASPGRTPTLTPKAAAGSSPSGSNAKTPTMQRMPSPSALEREAQDKFELDERVGPGLGGGARLGLSGGDRGQASLLAGTGTSPLSPIADDVGTSIDDGRLESRATSAQSQARSQSQSRSLSGTDDEVEEAKTGRLAPLDTSMADASGSGGGVVRRSSLSPVSLIRGAGTGAGAGAGAGGAVPPSLPTTSTPTKTRASMSSLRNALAASAPTAPPMMPSRSATGGSTGGSGSGGGGGGGSGGTSAAAAGPGVGGSAWTYTSRASEWKTASSSSVSRGAGAISPSGGAAGSGFGHGPGVAGVGMAGDPRAAASSTSLASRASSREGLYSAASIASTGGGGGRPGLPRRTSHGVAGSMYREHFADGGALGGGDGDGDDHSSRISHMLDEDEEREREREIERERSRSGSALGKERGSSLRRSGSAKSKGGGVAGGAGGGLGGVAAALMRKTSSRSYRSARGGTTLAPGPAEEA